MAQYEADDYAVKNEKLDLRTIPKRMKNLLLHDKDIIEITRVDMDVTDGFGRQIPRLMTPPSEMDEG